MQIVVIDRYGQTKTALGLHDGAVVTAKLDDGAVTEPKLSDGAVTDVKLGLRGVRNALAYGADPAGVLDSTAAIQAALDAIKAAGGGRLYLPAGLYTIGAIVVTDADYFSIYGDGVGRTILVESRQCRLGPTGPVQSCRCLGPGD